MERPLEGALRGGVCQSRHLSTHVGGVHGVHGVHVARASSEDIEGLGIALCAAIWCFLSLPPSADVEQGPSAGQGPPLPRFCASLHNHDHRLPTSSPQRTHQRTTRVIHVRSKSTSIMSCGALLLLLEHCVRQGPGKTDLLCTGSRDPSSPPPLSVAVYLTRSVGISLRSLLLGTLSFHHLLHATQGVTLFGLASYCCIHGAIALIWSAIQPRTAGVEAQWPPPAQPKRTPLGRRFDADSPACSIRCRACNTSCNLACTASAPKALRANAESRPVLSSASTSHGVSPFIRASSEQTPLAYHMSQLTSLLPSSSAASSLPVSTASTEI